MVRAPTFTRSIATPGGFTGETAKQGFTPIADADIFTFAGQQIAPPGARERTRAIVFSVDALNSSGEPLDSSGMTFTARGYIPMDIRGDGRVWWVRTHSATGMTGTTLISQLAALPGQSIHLAVEAVANAPGAMASLQLSAWEIS